MTSPINDNGNSCREKSLKASGIAHAGHDSEGWEFEVFLSFRGLDTCTMFTDSLYEDLVRAGIRVFRDENELRLGDKIGTELSKGIEQSKIYIPILSPHYADRKWCLNELAAMVEHCKENGRVIMPIYYGVELEDIKHHIGSYGKAFYEHERNRGVEKSTIQQWKEALRYVADIEGWQMDSNFDGYQGKIVKKIVSQVSEKLNTTFVEVTENYIGLYDQADELMREIDTDSSDVRIAGIYGISGIGKTTLAKFIFDQLCTKFQHYSFLIDVKERSKSKGIEHLQRQLISDILEVNAHNIDDGLKIITEKVCSKKALIVIDDVDHPKQLEMLAKTPDWFGPGSRIIITTRDKQVLDGFKIAIYHEAKALNVDNSLKLFSKHAFKKDIPLKHFTTLSKDIVTILRGHPLSLKVVGSLLRNKEERFWQYLLKRLGETANKEVLNVLKLGYEALEDWLKQMFLDIACLFIGFDKTTVSYMWESCDIIPEYGIAILVNMSLVKVDAEDKLCMHDQLKELGRKIVQENDEQLGKPTMFLSHEDSVPALKGKKVRLDLVKALCLGTEDSQYATGKLRLTNKDFKALDNLIYFQAAQTDISGDFKGLLPELRWLQWSVQIQRPWTSTLSHFCPEKLVILDLSNSIINEKWRGWRLLKDAKNLKVLNLSHCENLRLSPRFLRDAVLETLILTGCKNLVLIHPSLWRLSCLVHLDLCGCESLENLPLETSNTEDSDSAQDSSWTLNLATTLRCTEPSTASIREQQDMSLRRESKELQVLSLRYCHCIQSLPESIGMYELLMELDLGYTQVSVLPESIGSLLNLKVLILCETPITELPECIWNLKRLEVIDANGCRGLGGEIHSDIENLSYLRILRLGFTKITFIPRSISELNKLEELDLSDLNLESLPELPPSLKFLSACCSSQGKTSHLKKLINLEELELDQGLFPISDIGTLYKLKQLTFKSYHAALPTGIGALQRLVSLKIESSSINTLSVEISSLPQLRELSVYDCNELKCLPKLPSRLSKLYLSFCCSLEDLGDLSDLKYLCSLTIDRCPVREIKGLYGLQSLTELCLRYCHNMQALDGLEQLKCMTKMYIYCCVLIEKLPDLSNLNNLREIYNHGCSKKLEIKGINSTVRIRSQRIEDFEN